MTYRLVIKQEAVLDTQAAYDYYERQKPGLGERFLEHLVARYNDISTDPENYSFLSGDERKILRDIKLRSFPFVVIFEISATDEVVVYSVRNTHRKPR